MPRDPQIENLFPGDSDMHRFLGDHDWSKCSLGHPSEWPQSIRSSISMMLDFGFPGAIALGPDLQLIYNDAFKRMSGSKHPAMFTARLADAWAEAWPVMEPIVQRTLEGETRFYENFPGVILRGDRPERAWFSFSYAPVRDDDQRIAGLLTLSYETTQQVMARERQEFQLKLSDELRALSSADEIIFRANSRLADHLMAARVGYVEADEKGKYQVRHEWCAAGMEALTGQTVMLEEFGPALIENLRSARAVRVDDVGADPDSAGHADAYRALGLEALIAVPLLKSGRLRAILYVGSRHTRKWSELDLLMAQDMVERTWMTVETAQVQATLRAQRDRSQYIFDSMTEGFAILDNNWRIVQMNAEGLRIGRRTPEQVIGRRHWEVWPETLGSAVEDLYLRVSATNQADSVEYEHPLPEGRKVWLEVRGYPLMDGGLAVFFRDIQERKQAEEAMKEANRRKDEFLAMLAHELRNPLAPISAAAEVLQMKGLDESHVRQTSEIISRQVRHMTSLVNDLLDVSRVTRGLVELDTRTMDLREAIDEAVEQIGPLIRARHHTLDVRVPQEPVLIIGDRKRLVQVLSNLLNNAAKYTPQRGYITLETRAAGDFVEISIADNGIGMDQDLADSVFELFVQETRSSDRASGGMGLGLPLVRSLVEIHGGTASCSSRGKGTGSTFFVRLPLLTSAPEAQDLTPKPAPAPSRNAKTSSILVVDDNKDAARMLAMLLESFGHEVAVEFGPYQALARARAFPPSICLLDIGLPDMDGYELAQKLRTIQETRDARLIAITGYGQPQDREKALAAGFDDHLVKPVDMAALMQILADASR